MTYDELCEEYAKIDSFMEPQVTRDLFFEVETAYLFGGGSEFIPFWAYEPGEHVIIDETEGYGARLSAPGYLDCTDWVIFDTEQEAIDYLAETYLED